MRGWIGAAALVAAAFLAFGVIVEALAPSPQGPAGSSYATASGGAAAYAELLARAGYTLRSLRDPLASAALPTGPRATLIVLGASGFGAAEARRIQQFASSGATVLIAGGDPPRVLRGLIADPPSWTAVGPAYRPPGKLPQSAGVSQVRTLGQGAWTSEPGGSLLVVRPYGQGRFELLADVSPLTNQLLDAADNAKLALNLAGAQGATVVFDETLHGFGRATGLAAVPGNWWVALASLMLAAIVLAASRARRLGPAEQPAPQPAPPRSAYVNGMAGLLIRTRDQQRIDRLAGELVDSDR